MNNIDHSSLKVVDCLGIEFENSCVDLAQLVMCHCTPDLWLGVETGGAYILRTMSSLGQLNAPFAFVKATRPNSKKKKKWLPLMILSKLPRAVLNTLRIAEHHIREWRFERSRQVVERNIYLPANSTALIQNARVIALIDDAVDSGSSIVQIIDAIRRTNSSCDVIVAVVVETFRNPLRAPDLCLRRNELVRFPWSVDAQLI